jgi:predicted Zn-dependent protease with MMP-like domain
VNSAREEDPVAGSERILLDHDAGAGTGETGPVVAMSREEFEEAVAEGLDEVPAELTRLMRNVVVLVEDDPPEDEPDILGLYEGTPLTERGEWYAAGSLPDRITIFRNPTLAVCDTREDVVEEVAVTVVHEIAHHFGIDDERLHELGWG